jgi:hypothetical protein
MDWTDYEHVVESRQKAMVYDVETGKLALIVADSPRDHHLKGNYGEAKQDLYMKGEGNQRISTNPTYEIDAPTRQGIDGVYEQPNGWLVVADAKYNKTTFTASKYTYKTELEK